jgi:hypothetical protein
MLDHDAEQCGGVVDKFARRRGGQLLYRRASQGCAISSHGGNLMLESEHNKNIFRRPTI